MASSLKSQCNALKKGDNKERCEAKETYPGSGTCRHHGGMAFATAHKALRRIVLTNVARINEVQEGQLIFASNPFDALNQALLDTHEFKDLISRMLHQMGEDGEAWRYKDKGGAEQLDSRVALYERALDRTIRAATALAKLNIEERFVKLSEQQATSLMYIINEVFKRVGMTEDQREEARNIVPLVIREMLTQPSKKRYI